MLPEFVAGTRGSNRLSALPTGSKWNRALPGLTCRQKARELSGQADQQRRGQGEQRHPPGQLDPSGEIQRKCGGVVSILLPRCIRTP